MWLLATRNKGLRLSEAELPLAGGVAETLAAHVSAGLADTQARASSFVDRRDDRPCGAFSKLLGQRPGLVEVSQQLASALYDIAEEDERVKDGTDAVLLCRATDAGGAGVRFPAVLKLDPSATLHTVTDTDPASGNVDQVRGRPDWPPVKERARAEVRVRARRRP